MMESRSVDSVAANVFGWARLKAGWERVLALFTFVVGFAALLAPGEN